MNKDKTKKKTKPAHSESVSSDSKNSHSNNSNMSVWQKEFNKLFAVIPPDYIFAAFCACFCFVSFMTLITTKGSYKELAFVNNVNLTVMLCFVAVIFAILMLIAYKTKSKRLIPLSLLVSSVLFGSALAYKGADISNSNEANIYMNIAVGFVMFFVTAWICKDDKLSIEGIVLPKYSLRITAGVGVLLFTIVVSAACIARYSAYMAHNFDFGIFTQMFENMRTTGLADTTVERNKLMSHFGVHYSPFFYFLLPFYALCPRPETLLVLQALFIAVGVIPVMLICKHLNISRLASAVISVMYLLFPALANGCIYDFHENKFLTVLILWALYFIIKDNLIGTAVFCLLTLMVKEDAAIYVMAIALYVILSRKKFLFGGVMLAAAAVYFMLASSVVASLGSGIMDDRLANYMINGEGGLSAVVKNCLSDFGYLLSQVFTKEKIMFIVWMLLPVAFAPFFSEKKSMLVLFIPMLAVDLMSNWKYQYDIGYQYTYGVAALIIFMTIMVVAAANQKTRNIILTFGISMSVVMSCSLFLPRSEHYHNMEKTYSSTTEQYTRLIESIPTDAEITANGSYIPHMYQFKNLYQYPNYYDKSKKTQYLLVSRTDVENNNSGLADFMGNDYELVNTAGNMQLYKLKNTQ